MSAGYHWDPAQYDRFARERNRPFHELVARVDVASPTRVIDIGCGPGSLTRSLLDRWPGSRVTGVDASVDMIAAARPLEVEGELDFVVADLATWQPDSSVDVVVGNAVLQWVPTHLELLGTIVGWLAPGGVLAFQVPDNFADPSHAAIRDLQRSSRWREQLASLDDRAAAVERPETYLNRLADLGCEADVWQTTYLHLLPGEDAALEWVKGTALRPALDVLADDPAATADFLADCRDVLSAAYPRGPHGTLFPFRRTFAVGTTLA